MNRLLTVTTLLLLTAGCSSTGPSPTRGTPFTQTFSGRLEPAGSVNWPLNVDGPGTVTVSLSEEGNDLFFLLTADGTPCLRNDCVPYARMDANHQLTYHSLRAQPLRLVIWHVYDTGQARDYALQASFQ